MEEDAVHSLTSIMKKRKRNNNNRPWGFERKKHRCWIDQLLVAKKTRAEVRHTKTICSVVAEGIFVAHGRGCRTFIGIHYKKGKKNSNNKPQKLNNRNKQIDHTLAKIIQKLCNNLIPNLKNNPNTNAKTNVKKDNLHHD